MMDQLRQHQTDLKKTEGSGVDKWDALRQEEAVVLRQKKIGSLEKQSQERRMNENE